GAGAGAQSNEDGGKTEHEERSAEHGRAPDLRIGFLVRQALERQAGEIDEIGRRQRQHAGRQEADQPGDQRGGYGDIGGHGSSMRYDAVAAQVTFLPFRSGKSGKITAKLIVGKRRAILSPMWRGCVSPMPAASASARASLPSYSTSRRLP